MTRKLQTAGLGSYLLFLSFILLLLRSLWIIVRGWDIVEIFSFARLIMLGVLVGFYKPYVLESGESITFHLEQTKNQKFSSSHGYRIP